MQAANEAEEVESLRQELAAAKRQISELQQDLAASRAEAAHLREQQQQQQQAGRDAATAADAGPGSIAKMQERLARLRKEQSEAEAEREAAWAQVKAVVSDISALAAVDNLASVNIPSRG